MSDTKKKPRKRRRVVNWDVAREKFITMNLARDGKRYTLLELSKDLNMAYGSIKNRAAEDKWEDQLRQAFKDKQDKAIQTAISTTNVALEQVKQETVNDEVAVRKRQANVARMLQSKAATRLKNLDPEKLTIREAISLLQLGLVEERRALGFADKYEFVPEQQQQDHLTMDRAKQVLGRVINLVQKEGGNYEQEEEKNVS